MRVPRYGGGRPWRRPGPITRGITLVTTAVALVAVVLTGVTAWYLVRTGAEAQQRDQLGRQAEVLSRTPVLSELLLDREQRLAGSNGQQVAVVTPGGETVGPATAAVDGRTRTRLLSGEAVSTEASLNGTDVLVEGRPTPGGGAVVLTQPYVVVHDSVARMRRALPLPLVVGLVGGGLAGLLLARRLSRPLTAAATTARRLAEGERGLRAAPGGPRELTDLTRALNVLDAALAHSENRQREFLLSVSHELRTPLTATLGYAEALADGVVGPEELPMVGETLLSETRRLERFVQDLLDLAHLETDDFRVETRPVDLDALAGKAGTVWAGRCARHGVVFRVERPGRPLTVETDGVRVRQMIDGLAENALRVTPAGAPLVLALAPDGDGARIQVRDGGPGLTPEDAAVAFERGTLHARYQGVRPVGTGLGLAIVHRLAQRLGGSVTARGHGPEGGACFTVRVPGRPGASG
ncbi:HAMP domain-containing histidine kinase [Streptomyces sp. NBC_01571]|uniref:sensor histidine kinase n=1 Tax=Streptomyces sp. NBC_01571 TaxID=2975883 RepID=UPI00225C2150|nr:HAMP domain-containing sensor histidine kinase [Streptomyces sp. NBC_01571]MCX4572527.1 HAMP domain-containing histidine kinase [Streptomyces sp. NBC_01571]